MEANAPSATHFCPGWAKGFSRAAKGLGVGTFKLNEYLVSVLEAELICGEAAREPGSWGVVPAV